MKTCSTLLTSIINRIRNWALSLLLDGVKTYAVEEPKGHSSRSTCRDVRDLVARIHRESFAINSTLLFSSSGKLECRRYMPLVDMDRYLLDVLWISGRTHIYWLPL